MRLLEAVGEFLATRSYADFAALVRHPDVAAWLSKKMGDRSDPLTALDEFHETRLPARMADDWLLSLPKGHPVARTVEPLKPGENVVVRLDQDVAAKGIVEGSWVRLVDGARWQTARVVKVNDP